MDIIIHRYYYHLTVITISHTSVLTYKVNLMPKFTLRLRIYLIANRQLHNPGVETWTPIDNLHGRSLVASIK